MLKKLLLKTKKKGGFLYLSTSEVYSGINKQNFEDKIGNSNTNHIRACYIQSKLAGETLVNIFKRKFNINAKSVRLCLAYGPGNKKKDKLGDEIWNKLEDSNYKNEIFNNSEPVECSFPKSTLITCDTSGFHKKGFSDGQKERFTIGFVTKRGSMYEKFKSAFF